MTPSKTKGNGSSGKVIMLSLLLVSAFPVLLGAALYGTSWRPAHFTNYGELVQPARQMTDVAMQTLDGKAAKWRDFRHKWALVYVGSNHDCTRDCRDSLYKMRQLRLALARDMGRMQTLLLLTGAVDMPDMVTSLRDYPELTVLSASGDRAAAIQQQFQHASSTTVGQGSLYLMDPMGNLMMRYPVDAEPEKMLKDLKHLLKNSRIG